MKKIDFYFDFLSPFSFFAWKNLHKMRELEGTEINYYPVILGTILNHHGAKGPGEIEVKRQYLYKNCLRYAKRHNISFLCPKTHPFNPLYALRLATKECSGELQQKVIDILWKAGWEEGIDLGSETEIAQSLEKANLPSAQLMEKTYEKAVKNAVKINTQNLIDAGGFGVPSMVVNGAELFWGNDSLNDVVNFLNGKDDLDRKLFEEILAKTPRGASQNITF